MASRNPHPADTTRTPSRNSAPNAFSGASCLSRYTNSVSAVINAAATTMPSHSGGAVGRTTNASRRAYIDGRVSDPGCAGDMDC